MTKRHKNLIMCASILFLSFGGTGVTKANAVGTDTVAEYKVANNSLDGLGSSTYTNSNNGVQNLTTEDVANKNSASAVGDLFQNAGVTTDATNQASTFLEPLARGINIVCAFILGATSLGIFLVTALDLLYIAFPPVRNMLNPQPQGGGYGGGQESTAVRWISDEAIACAGGGASSGGGMGSPMGGMGGMGSPMGGSAQGGSAKSMIASYLKKRTVFLVVFAICVILFTSTVFTDLGLKLGMLILSWITGMSGSIPV